MGVPGFVLDKPEDTAAPDDDEEFGHLMAWYQDIRNRAPRGQQYEPVELQAIAVYKREFLAEMGIEMTVFDWDMLARLDWVWMDSQPKTEAEAKAAARRRKATKH